ncbi:MAG: flagellar filament capping protein FliD [Pseudomonadota bacterium]|nr:flagellar filament capping protein FliD [Pseudomonadota bacterium]
MANISFQGINTGLPPNLIEKIMEAERMPIQNLELKKGKTEIKLKLIQDLEAKVGGITGTLGELAGTRGFTDYELNSSNPAVVTGIVDPTKTSVGNWNIEVVEMPQKASAITNGFPDKDQSEVGVGYLSFVTADGDKEVYIDGTNNTLQGVAAKINQAGVGIKATIINDRKDKDYPYKLVLASNHVGEDNQIEYPKLYFLDGDQDFFFEDSKQAKNGVIKIDGFEMEISDTKVEDIIPGVTLEIKGADPGKNVSVGVKENQEAVSGKVEGFVKAMNEVMGFVQTQNKMDKTTDTSKTLGGDSILRSVESRMHRIVQDPVLGTKGDIKRLNQLGIVFTRAGTLDFDKDKFRNSLARNSAAVQAFFSGDGYSTGFIQMVKRELGAILNASFGPIANRKKGLQHNISAAEDQIARKEKQLEKKEEALKKQFSRLEETMSKLKSQGASLGALGGGSLIGGASLGGMSG